MNPSKALSKLDYIIGRLGKFKPIRAYHGSPHSFSRFDSSKIGTGEGAQAYGHGLYFSEAEPVAEWYRKELSGSPEILIGGEPLPLSRALSNTPRERAIRLLQKSAINHYDNPMLAVREAMLDASDQYGGRDVQPIIDSLMRFKSDGVSFGPRPGKTYEVEIGYPEEALLDLDAPVGSQPKAVQDALAEFANAPSHFAFGQEGWRGKDAYMTAAERGASQAEASRFFRDRGMPGLRYWDGNSLAAGEGTRNYVIFPGAEDAIKILRKYGFLPPVAAAAAMSGEEQ